MAELAPQFKGWLYLPTDADGDEGTCFVCCGCRACRDRDQRSTICSYQPHPHPPKLHTAGVPGGFPVVAGKHPAAQHVAVNNKDLSLALAKRLVGALDALPHPVLISCRWVV